MPTGLKNAAGLRELVLRDVTLGNINPISQAPPNNVSKAAARLVTASGRVYHSALWCRVHGTQGCCVSVCHKPATQLVHASASACRPVPHQSTWCLLSLQPHTSLTLHPPPSPPLLQAELEHPGIEHLEMHGCRGSYITVRGPALRSVLVTAPLFGGLNLLCQQLNRLALHQCSKMGDGGIRAMVTRLTSLTALDISGCTVVTDESLRHVSQGPPACLCNTLQQCTHTV
jgi:hypothetical protein